MAPRKRAPRRRMRKGKGARRSRVPRSLGQFKPYSYVFKLPPQIISTDGQATVRLPTISPQTPIKPGSITNYTTASSGFTNCVDWGLAFAPQLSDLASVASFTGMYDAYRIDKVTVTVQYLCTSLIPGSTNGSVVMPTFVMYADNDDAVTPPDIYALSRRQGSKRFQPTTSKLAKTFTFKPRILVGTQISPSGLASGIITKPTWLDCANPNVSHFGFKMTCQDFGVPVQGFHAIRMNYSYHVSFRAPLITN